MNFFEQQARAKRSSAWLVLMMLVAMVAMTTLISVVLALILHHYFPAGPGYRAHPLVKGPLGQWLDARLLAEVGAGVATLVVGGSLYKAIELRGGGRVVAERLGGRLITRDTQYPQERQLLNVVEEMALACGAPVPSVYLLDEVGINAFAAGTTPDNAVIGITLGALEHLSRDELQGIIAHEFSHIFHGDMRFNTRLTAVVHGMILVGLIGGGVLRTLEAVTAPFAARPRDPSEPAPPPKETKESEAGKLGMLVLVIGIALLLLGAVGTFFGNCIKAAFGRQREFLADAAAVQFTRNPESIAGALKKIGGLSTGSMIKAEHLAEFNHLFFAASTASALTGMLATHPPLAERIQRIEPSWNGHFTDVVQAAPVEDIQPAEDVKLSHSEA